MERTISLFRKLSENELSRVQAFVPPTLEPLMSYEEEEIGEQTEGEKLQIEDKTAQSEWQETESLEQMKQEIQRMLICAKEESVAIQEEARIKGHELGYEEGYELGIKEAKSDFEKRYQEEMGRIKEEVKEAILSIEQEKEQMLEEYLEDLKNVSLTVAEKIIQVSLKTSDEIIKRMVIAATEKLKKKAWAKIYIGNSKETINIQGDASFMKELSRLSDNVKVIVMDEEEAGTCIVELPDEIMDISVTTQLENIKDILNNAKLLKKTEEYRE